jgi:ABC-type antimicrobial peptide transport system permease subunit
MIPESITDRQTANSSFILPHILKTTPRTKYLYSNDYTMVASIKSLSRWALLGMALLVNGAPPRDIPSILRLSTNTIPL